jgi:hypothetical protein
MVETDKNNFAVQFCVLDQRQPVFYRRISHLPPRSALIEGTIYTCLNFTLSRFYWQLGEKNAYSANPNRGSIEIPDESDLLLCGDIKLHCYAKKYFNRYSNKSVKGDMVYGWGT